jgi:hypothetical protein
MKTVGLAILLLGASGAALATPLDSRGGFIKHEGFTTTRYDQTTPASAPAAAAVAAPEIDPASLFTALTLLAGGLLVMRGRSSLKPTA